MSQSTIESGSRGIGEAIDTKISGAKEVLKNGNGTNIIFQEVPLEVLRRADGLSNLFEGRLPTDIDPETEARLTLASGESSRSLRLAIFSTAGLSDSSQVDVFRVDFDEQGSRITENHDFTDSNDRPYLPEFDSSLIQLIDGSHPLDLSIEEMQEILQDYVNENEWSEKDIREIQNALMTAQLNHRVIGPDGEMHPQRRASGELYISHPWETMQELINAGVTNPDVLKAALVHDVPEDPDDWKQPEIDPETGVAPKSYRQWRQETWDKLAPVIGEVAATYAMLLARPRPDGIEFFSKEQANQAYRLNLTEYHEVLLIKMADRLHNIRTLDSMPPDKQKATILSTIDNYIPIFEFARAKYPDAVDYLMNELMNALRAAGINNNIDVDTL